MPRKSTKKNKSMYQIIREEKGLTREAASEIIGINPERIERIENNKTKVNPKEILTMSMKYDCPELCNYYCSHDCAIGEKYIPEVEIKDLSQVVLEMINSFNQIQDTQKRLIEITVDGTIDDTECTDFMIIQEKLEQISLAIETLQLWAEKNGC